jgi:DNA-binding XRE family transcriptional regulator
MIITAVVNRLELREWRRTRYLTQAALAHILGVAEMTVNRWETGETTVPPYLHLALETLHQEHDWSPDGVEAVPRIGKRARA